MAVRHTLHIESEWEQVSFFSPFGSLKNLYEHLITSLRGAQTQADSKQTHVTGLNVYVEKNAEHCRATAAWIENVPLWPLCSSSRVLWQILTLYFLNLHAIYRFREKKLCGSERSQKINKQTNIKIFKGGQWQRANSLHCASAQHWILVLLHTSLHTSRHVVKPWWQKSLLFWSGVRELK